MVAMWFLFNAGKTDGRSSLLRALSCGCDQEQGHSFTPRPSLSIPHGWSCSLLSVSGTRQQGPLTRVRTGTKIAYHRMQFSKEKEILTQSPIKGQDWGARGRAPKQRPLPSSGSTLLICESLQGRDRHKER